MFERSTCEYYSKLSAIHGSTRAIRMLLVSEGPKLSGHVVAEDCIAKCLFCNESRKEVGNIWLAKWNYLHMFLEHIIYKENIIQIALKNLYKLLPS